MMMRLYKYYKWDRAIEALSNNTLYFKDVFHLNDALESVIMFDKKRDQDGTPQSLPEVIYRAKGNGKDIGLCCFSEEDTNILMWSHYAGNEGICLGFDFSLTNSYAGGGVWLANGGGAYYGKVDYSTAFFTFDPDGNFLLASNDFREAMTHKLSDWTYEKEVRLWIVGQGKANTTMRMLPNTIKEIIFGVRVDGAKRRSIHSQHENTFAFFQIGIDPKNHRYIKKPYP
jgi:hypothetical protein